MSLTSTTFSKEIIKDEQDECSYRFITLDKNGLQVLLIHDPSTDQASAALDINVGSVADPDDIPGLAHLVQCMQFTGSAKYPVVGDYGKYVNERSGGMYGYTTMCHTNHYLKVSQECLYGALDRFAQFFIAPLFDPDFMDLAMKCIDSEHKKHIQDDPYRLVQIRRATSNLKHPSSKFGNGCLESLSDNPEIRDALLEFYNRYYSANLMRLVIHGKDSLDQLEAWATELFSDISNKKVDPFICPPGELPLSGSELCTVVYARTIEMQTLTIEWPIEDQRKYYRTKPHVCLWYLLGYEGPGGIISLLRSNGWATSISTHATHEDEWGFFLVEIELTDVGLTKHREIVKLVFGYINLLKQSGGVTFEAWEERKKSHDFIFKWQTLNNDDPAERSSLLAENLHIYAPEHIVCGDFLMDQFDPASIQELLDSLNADNFRYILAHSRWQTRDFRQLKWCSEHWHGAEFCVQSLPKDFLEALHTSQPDPSFSLPPPNPFIPENFDVISDTPFEVLARCHFARIQ